MVPFSSVPPPLRGQHEHHLDSGPQLCHHSHLNCTRLCALPSLADIPLSFSLTGRWLTRAAHLTRCPAGRCTRRCRNRESSCRDLELAVRSRRSRRQGKSLKAAPSPTSSSQAKADLHKRPQPVRDDSGLRNTDVFLTSPSPLHTLLTLLRPQHFYLRFFSLQLLGILLANRSTVVQGYVLTSPGGVGRLVETLDDAREIIRNGQSSIFRHGRM